MLLGEGINDTPMNKSLWAPMKFVQIYLSFVFILFIFGPLPWPVENKFLVNLYLIMAQLLLLFGYFLSVKKRRIGYGNQGVIQKQNINIEKLIKYLMFISFGVFIANYLSRVGLSSFNFIEAYDNFINGLINPGHQYYEKLISSEQVVNNYTLLVIINAVTAPFKWLFIPLCIVNWGRIRKIYKFGMIIYVLLDIISWISIGTNKGIFDNVFIVGFSLLIKVYLDNTNIKKVIKRNKSKLKAMIFGLIGISFAVFYVTYGTTSRLGKVKYYYEPANINVNFDSPIMLIIPGFLKDALIIISTYLTQGYYGLSLAMREPFTTSYGVGGSWFLMGVFQKITGIDVTLRTYPFKIIGYGWDPYINWHSIYTWLSSDFSFIGTLIIMMVIGYWFGEVWKSVLFQKNIYGIGLFILFMIMFMYFPANNQVFAFINTFSAFWGLFILWIFSTKVKI